MAGPRRGPGRIPEKPKNFKGTITKLFRCLGRYRLPLVLVLVLALASTAFGIVGPKILSTATTELATGLGRKLSGLGGIDFGKIGKILLTVLALYLVSAACSFFQSWILAGITQKLAYRLRGEISAKIHRMPMRYFERNTVGDVLSRITNDVDTMSSGMAQSVTQLVTNVTMLVGVLVMMLRISWLMTLIALIVLPVTGVLTGRIVKRSQRYFVAQQKNLGDINGKVEETYAGHNVVCAFNREGATQRSSTPSTRGSTARRGRASFVRAHVAGDDVCQQARLRVRGRARRLACRARHHHDRRHSGISQLHGELHAADHAAGADQHAAADHGGRG